MFYDVQYLQFSLNIQLRSASCSAGHFSVLSLFLYIFLEPDDLATRWIRRTNYPLYMVNNDTREQAKNDGKGRYRRDKKTAIKS